MEELDSQVKSTQMEAFASSTPRTRASQWRSYESFCTKYELQSLPVSSENVCRFLVFKSQSVCYSTLTNYVSALNLLVKLDGEKLDLTNDPNRFWRYLDKLINFKNKGSRIGQL